MAEHRDHLRQSDHYIPGMRAQIRDAKWRIDRIDVPTHGGMLLTCAGHSELVRGRSAMFLTELENDIKILAPETTQLDMDADRTLPGARAGGRPFRGCRGESRSTPLPGVAVPASTS